MDLAKKVSDLFIKKIKDRKWTGKKEFHIGEADADYTTVRLSSNDEMIRITFKKKLSKGYFTFINNTLESSFDIESFEAELYYLAKFGDDLLDKLLDPSRNEPLTSNPKPKQPQRSTIKKSKELVVKTKTEEEISIQLDRLLDKYNFYQKMYQTTKEEKYAKRKDQLMRWLKKSNVYKHHQG